jgi:hypothetical protein
MAELGLQAATEHMCGYLSPGSELVGIFSFFDNFKTGYSGSYFKKLGF